MATSVEVKQQVIDLMLAGKSWQEAVETAGVKANEATAYRWVRQWRKEGSARLADQRHGYAHKITSEIRDWIDEACRADPNLSGMMVKKMVTDEFDIAVSRGHINRVRRELGVNRPRKLKKSP